MTARQTLANIQTDRQTYRQAISPCAKGQERAGQVRARQGRARHDR